MLLECWTQTAFPVYLQFLFSLRAALRPDPRFLHPHAMRGPTRHEVGVRIMRFPNNLKSTTTQSEKSGKRTTNAREATAERGEEKIFLFLLHNAAAA